MATMIQTILMVVFGVSTAAFRSELTQFASFLRENVSFTGFQTRQCKTNMVKANILPELVGISRIHAVLHGDTTAKFDSLAQFAAFLAKVGNSNMDIAKYSLYFSMKQQFSEFGASGVGRLSLLYLENTCGFTANNGELTTKSTKSSFVNNLFGDVPAQKSIKTVENVQETQDIAEIVRIAVANALANATIKDIPAGLTKVGVLPARLAKENVNNAPKTKKTRDDSRMNGTSF